MRVVTERVVASSSPIASVFVSRMARHDRWSAVVPEPYLTMMLQAHIPAGQHMIELSYWPKRFTEGLVIAALVVVGFVVAGIVIRRRDILERLRRKSSG